MLAPAPAGGHTQAHRRLQQVHAPIYRAVWQGCQCIATAGTGSTKFCCTQSHGALQKQAILSFTQVRTGANSAGTQPLLRDKGLSVCFQAVSLGSKQST